MPDEKNVINENNQTEEKKVKRSVDGVAYGSALGLTAGIALGLITGEVAYCVAGGALAGLAVGYFIDTRLMKKQEKNEITEEETSTDNKGE